jgi:hypothetical protein
VTSIGALLAVLSYSYTALTPMNIKSLVTVTVILWMSGFLCVLNIALAVIFRKRPLKEVWSYYAACGVEFALFAFGLLLYLGIIPHIPYHLPSNSPISRADIGAALALSIGLFPAAYWHRINISELPERIAQDAQTVKDRNGGVHIRKSSPGEWMN